VDPYSRQFGQAAVGEDKMSEGGHLLALPISLFLTD
jgi:hypothetical protein